MSISSFHFVNIAAKLFAWGWLAMLGIATNVMSHYLTKQDQSDDVMLLISISGWYAMPLTDGRLVVAGERLLTG